MDTPGRLAELVSLAHTGDPSLASIESVEIKRSELIRFLGDHNAIGSLRRVAEDHRQLVDFLLANWKEEIPSDMGVDTQFQIASIVVRIISRLVQHDASGWKGLSGIYHLITSEECDPQVALEKATLAVSQLLRQKDRLESKLNHVSQLAETIQTVAEPG